MLFLIFLLLSCCEKIQVFSVLSDILIRSLSVIKQYASGYFDELPSFKLNRHGVSELSRLRGKKFQISWSKIFFKLSRRIHVSTFGNIVAFFMKSRSPVYLLIEL